MTLKTYRPGHTWGHEDKDPGRLRASEREADIWEWGQHGEDMEGDTEDAGAGEAAAEAEGGNERPYPRLNPHPRPS